MQVISFVSFVSPFFIFKNVCSFIFFSNNIDVDPQQNFFPKMSSRQSGATRDLKKSIVEISQSLCFFDMTSTKQFLGQLLYCCFIFLLLHYY